MAVALRCIVRRVLVTERTLLEPRRLRRGGLWIPTPVGPVQFGAPSETIKDTLRDELGVPNIFVLGKHLFDPRRGLSYADLEFPIYFNLFAKQRPLRVVTTRALADRVRGAVKEALLGPDELLLEQDYAPGCRVADLRREYEYFRRGPYRSGALELDDALELLCFEDGRVSLGEGVFVDEDRDGFTLSWGGAPRVRFPADPPLPSAAPEPPCQREPFVPPAFGVTTLGRSHGFDPDPDERTSGFVLWVGGRGVMVDPPVHAVDVLRAAEIDLKHIAAILLTHCHADHDAGTLQKALIGGRVTLYTTPTIFASYRRKWSLLSGIPEPEIEKLLDFRPVQVGAPMSLEKGLFIFRYTLHSIPTIAFEAHYSGKSFSYSSDTLNDPARIEAIYAEGGLEPERREELLGFDWGHDLVFHEAGVPPLHTRLEVLMRLPRAVRRRVVVVHITPSRVTPDTGLRVARPGRRGTIALNVEEPPEERVARDLRLLGEARLFSSLPLSRAADLLAACERRQVRAGDCFIREGDEGDRLYVVTAGRASIVRDGRELKVYGVGDTLGETAVFLGRPRNASVHAKTDLEVLAIDGARVRELCEGTDAAALVKRHARVRELDAWSLFEETELFSDMTVAQRTALEMMLKPKAWKAGASLATAGAPLRELLLVQEGAVRSGSEALGRGAVVGDPAALLTGGQHVEDAVADGPGRGFRLSGRDFKVFLEQNPGVRVRVQPWGEAEDTATSHPMVTSLIELLEELL